MALEVDFRRERKPSGERARLQTNPKDLPHPRRQIEVGDPAGHVEQFQAEERQILAAVASGRASPHGWERLASGCRQWKGAAHRLYTGRHRVTGILSDQ